MLCYLPACWLGPDPPPSKISHVHKYCNCWSSTATAGQALQLLVKYCNCWSSTQLLVKYSTAGQVLQLLVKYCNSTAGQVLQLLVKYCNCWSSTATAGQVLQLTAGQAQLQQLLRISRTNGRPVGCGACRMPAFFSRAGTSVLQQHLFTLLSEHCASTCLAPRHEPALRLTAEPGVALNMHALLLC
jgi:hypothetical protein